MMTAEINEIENTYIAENQQNKTMQKKVKG